MSSRPTGVWALCILYGTTDQKEWSLDFWFKGAPAPAPPAWNGDMAAIAIGGAIASALQLCFTTSTTIRGQTLIVNDGTGSVGFVNKTPTVGTVSGTPLPEDVAGIVQKNTTLFTRGSQGRWYVPSLPDTFATGSYLNTTGLTALQTAFNIIATNNIEDQGISWTPSHWHKIANNLLPLVGSTPVPLLGTRRRRRFKF